MIKIIKQFISVFLIDRFLDNFIYLKNCNIFMIKNIYNKIKLVY